MPRYYVHANLGKRSRGGTRLARGTKVDWLQPAWRSVEETTTGYSHDADFMESEPAKKVRPT